MFTRLSTDEHIAPNIKNLEDERALYVEQCQPTFNHYRRQQQQNYLKKLKSAQKTPNTEQQSAGSPSPNIGGNCSDGPSIPKRPRGANTRARRIIANN